MAFDCNVNFEQQLAFRKQKMLVANETRDSSKNTIAF